MKGLEPPIMLSTWPLVTSQIITTAAMLILAAERSLGTSPETTARITMVASGHQAMIELTNCGEIAEVTELKSPLVKSK